MVEYWSSMHEVLNLIPALPKLGLVVQDYNTNVRGAKRGGPEVQGEYKTSLGYMRTPISH